MARRTASRSLMLPLMKEILLRISARLSSLPAERSSRTTTLSPRRTSSSTVLEPINPAPPVTTYRIRSFLRASFAIPPSEPVGPLEHAESFLKTRENASGNLKQRSLGVDSRDTVVYDESPFCRISNRDQVAGKL